MKIITNVLITLIKGYRYLLSPLLGNTCRYLPTCSEYSIEALKTYGFFKGLFLSIKRMPKGTIILFGQLNTRLYPGETLAFLMK